MSGLAVLIDEDGAVRSVLREGEGVLTAHVGRPFEALLDPSSAGHGVRLLEQGWRVGLSVGHELLLGLGGQPRVVMAAVVRLDDQLCVLAGPETAVLRETCAQLTQHLPDAQRAELERALAIVEIRPSDVAVEQLVALNNRLATLERELAKKNAMLERAGQSKDRVLSMVAHDLRSPLNAIGLSISYLRHELDEWMTDAHEQVLSRVGRSAELMKRLIDDLVDVASLAVGAPSLERRRMELAPVLREALALHEGPSRESDVTLELLLPESLPEVEADPDRLHQVLGNLLSNAVGHTPAGGKVTLEAQVLDGVIEVRITDQGPGVAAEDAARIFEPYTRGTEQRRSGGRLGLGLAISRALVAAHGGELGFRNLAEGGAQFRFSLPAAESEGG